jgi:hypothetical protein
MKRISSIHSMPAYSCLTLLPPFPSNRTPKDRVGVCMGIFQHDNVDRNDVETLVDAFPGQSIDFFGALRARVYDDKVSSEWEWLGRL